MNEVWRRLNGAPTKEELRREEGRKRRERSSSHPRMPGKSGAPSNSADGTGRSEMPADFKLPPGWEVEPYTVQSGFSKGKRKTR